MEIKLKLDFPVEPMLTKLVHGDKVVLLGSCFSDEIGACFRQNGFDTLSNPFGTIFHPVPLSRIVSESLTEKHVDRTIQRNDLFFSWDAAGTVFAYKSNELDKEIQSRKQCLKSVLSKAKYLFVTLGSAFGYTGKTSNEIVANCHKIPGINFCKGLTDLSLMVSVWSKALRDLFALNSGLQVVFTVSPVRHIKDGLIDNNRSKARLMELVGALEEHSNVHYFPSYEIMMDELRDYRFFKTDGIHPNEQAIEYIWSRLKESIMNPETKDICNEIIALRKLEQHQTLYPGSADSAKFEENRSLKIQDFLQRHPQVIW